MAGYKIDWQQFVQFHDQKLEAFMKNPQAAPGEYYVALRRSHYFGGSVPFLEHKIAFRVISPIKPDLEVFSFADKRTLAGEDSEREFSWGKTYRPLLRLEWVTEQSEQPYMAITQVKRTTWR